jgi:hypothetical protein
MLREGSFTLASLGRVRKVHETAFAVAFGRESVALKRIFAAAFESPSSRGEATFANLMDVLPSIVFTPIDRITFLRPALLQPVSHTPRKIVRGSGRCQSGSPCITITEFFTGPMLGV